MEPDTPTYPENGVAETLRSSFPVIALFAFSAVAFVGPWQRYTPPIPPPTPVPEWATAITTAYNPNLKPEAHFANRTYACKTCHGNYRPDMTTQPMLYMHDNIILEHGLNDRCFNCHHAENRNALVDDWGREVPYDQPQLLCRKCHGPVYRDWLHGAHGRTNGYWDTRFGPKVRPHCDACHNPHQPPFPPMAPAPGPYTLRMGNQAFHPSRYEGHHPLRVYRQPGANEEVIRLERPEPGPVEDLP